MGRDLLYTLLDVPDARSPINCANSQRSSARNWLRLAEFYSVAFRKKLYSSLEELQFDLDSWMREYNEEHAHSEKYCFGKTPLETFRDSTHLAQEKMLDRLTVSSGSD